MTAQAVPWGLGSPRRHAGPRTKATPRASEGYLPPGWPSGVRPPGAGDWERTVIAFLLDACPADYRQYVVLRRHPLVLARFAARCVEAQLAATRAGLAECRASLQGYVPDDAIEAASSAWSEQEAALQRTAREINLVEQSLRGRAFVRKL